MRLGVFDQRGVTLLELLLALSIMAVLLVMLFGAFQMGGTFWEKSERELLQRDVWRIVPELVAAQLASPSVAAVYARDDKGIVAGGTQRRLAFFSQVSLFPESIGGNFYVEYRIEQRQDGYALLFYERALPFLDLTAPVEAPGDDVFELVAGCAALSFRYKIRQNDGGALWQDTWTLEDAAELPAAVALTIKKETDGIAVRRVVSLPGAGTEQ
ncbi:MAG: hypothetical protein CSA20_00290 [Deltaproteobacteria bacterium]|nr:MAG: hypothetical protein CSA20_00290 [Deltaproteobacteria bacterium]